MGKYETHRPDANAAAIIQAWRQAGASVEVIGRPVDCVVGRQGRNYLVEIKGPQGRLRPSQQTFVARWRGQVAVVRSVQEAIALLGI